MDNIWGTDGSLWKPMGNLCKSFGKPFAKVTLLNCGEVASTKPGEEVKSEDGAGEEQSSQ